MTLTLSKRTTDVPRGMMPARIKALCITTAARDGGWLADALAADRATQVELTCACGPVEGMARLREEPFDVVLVTHVPGELDALSLIEGLRSGGSDEALLVLGFAAEEELTAEAYEVGADAYLCISTTTIRTLLWTAARAIERHQLIRENQRLQQAHRQRLDQEHQEADRLLAEQRALVHDIEALAQGDVAAVDSADDRAVGLPAAAEAPPVNLPPQLVSHYREILRAYVMMGSGNLSAEMAAMAKVLATAGVSAQQAMLLHVQVLEELVRGLGNRSARHVMTRADLLVMELMVHLADSYRARGLVL